MDTKTIYFETYGCSANQNNTEIMKGIVTQAGLIVTNNLEIAEIVVVNSCIVKGPTEKKIERRISELIKTRKLIILAGCMPELRKLNGVYYLGTRHVKDIAKLIKKIYDNKYNENEFIGENEEIKLMTSKFSENKKIGITQISEGCLGACSYCITRFAKGKLFSYPEEDILKNIEKDIKSGCKEIWLTSQDNASYGNDHNTHSLPELLRKIILIKGKFKIRIGMMNPNNVLPILDELIEIYKSDKIYKFLHIPVQSASNKILKLMNRKYKIEDFKKIVEKFKKEIDIHISTDIIVGFPGESEEDFKETENLIKKEKFYSLNVSKFWPMKGTEAEKMNKIEENISKKRAKLLMEIYNLINEEENKKLINKETTALVTIRENKKYFARDENYRLIEIESEQDILGKFVNIKIIGTKKNHLIAKIK